MKKCGVYKIFHSKSGEHDCYIGSSINMKYRKAKHWSMLRGNYHENQILQRAWDKYGEENFYFEEVETFKYESDELLLAKEQKYIDEIKPRYNIVKIAGKPPVDPERSRKSISKLWEGGAFDIHKRPVDRIDPVSGEKTSFGSQQEAAELNKYASSSSISKCCLGQMNTYMGYYWRFSDGSSPKFESRTGTKRAVAQCNKDGSLVKIYDFLNDVRNYGFDPSAISNCCNGKRGSHKGYKWRFAEESFSNWDYEQIGTPVVCLDLKTDKIVKRYSSMAEAKKDGFDQGKISECCNKKRNKHKGYRWRFADE